MNIETPTYVDLSDSYAARQWRWKRLTHYRAHHAAKDDQATRVDYLWTGLGWIAVFFLSILVVIMFVGLTSSLAIAHDDAPQLNDVGREALRFCESSNNYEKVHYEKVPGASDQYVYGAYQFAAPTWRGAVAKMHQLGHGGTGWDQWIHVPPSEAPSWVQDHVVTFWWEWDKPHTQWPNCYQSAIEAMVTEPNKRVSQLPPIPAFTG